MSSNISLLSLKTCTREFIPSWSLLFCRYSLGTINGPKKQALPPPRGIILCLLFPNTSIKPESGTYHSSSKIVRLVPGSCSLRLHIAAPKAAPGTEIHQFASFRWSCAGLHIYVWIGGVGRPTIRRPLSLENLLLSYNFSFDFWPKDLSTSTVSSAAFPVTNNNKLFENSFFQTVLKCKISCINYEMHFYTTDLIEISIFNNPFDLVPFEFHGSH